MPRLWIVPAAGLGCAGLACATLAGPAAAQRLATLPIATSPVLAQAAARETAQAAARAARAGAALDRIPLRGVDPETTGALPAPLTAPPTGRAPCPPGRRVGTGAGFCLIN